MEKRKRETRSPSKPSYKDKSLYIPNQGSAADAMSSQQIIAIIGYAILVILSALVGFINNRPPTGGEEPGANDRKDRGK
jgi:hypothetical protein